MTSGLGPMTMRFTAAALKLESKHLETCLGCRRAFIEGDTTHLGYTQDGRVLVVGDCCATLLAETAVRHYFMARPFEVPPGSAKLWRYLSFAKYVSMLHTRSLFFCRLDNLGDPFEGAMGARIMEDKWCDHYRAFFRHAILNPPPGHKCNLSAAEVEGEADRLLRDFRSGNLVKPKSTYVSCWCEGDHESDAMWRLYSGDSATAVAIGTSAGRLSKSTETQINIGRVKYIDYGRQYPDISYPHFFKRKAFEHEREVRAVIISDPKPLTTVPGMLVGVDLNTLITSVRISPLANAWFREIVEDVTSRYDLSFSVSSSSLSEEPFS